METAFVYFVLAEPLRDPSVVDALFDRVEADEEITYILNDVDEHRENFKSEGTAKFSFLSDRLDLELGKHDGTDTHDRIPDPLSEYPLFFIHDDNVNYEHSGEFDGSDAQDNAEHLVDAAVDWYEWLVDQGVDVKYGFGDGGNRRETVKRDGVTFSEYHIVADRPGDIYWLQIFPAAMVETVGERTVDDAPAYRVESVADGGRLVLGRPSPWFDSPANEEHRNSGELRRYFETGA